MNEQEPNSGPLVIGRVEFERRPIRISDDTWASGSPDGSVFGGYPAYPVRPAPRQVDADALNRDYDTRVIHVDKRTHRIRFENETESEVTIVIEPKRTDSLPVRCDGPCGTVTTERKSGDRCYVALNANESCGGTYREA